MSEVVVTTANPDEAPAQARGVAYWDIVWRQFKKNPGAYWSLCLLGPLFLIAIFAPAIASNQPFVYYDGDQTLYPWFRSIFNPEEAVDYLFNMAMVGFFPWMVLAAVTNIRMRRRGVPGRRRVLNVALQYLAIIAVLCVLFLLHSGGRYWLRPVNKYWARTFTTEGFNASQSGHKGRGVYPPIAFSPLEIDLKARGRRPGYVKPADLRSDSNDGEIHWLGTDNTGRDVLTRMIYGARISMSVGFVAVGIYVTIGVVVGAIAGYFGGIIDILISRIIEIVLLFPAFFLILTLVAMIGPSIYVIMFVIGITSWATIARLTRGEVLKQRSIDYTAAARALGSSHFRIIFRHILPNALSPALVSAPFGIASAIITEAGLSLLGFGVRPPAPSWGSILQQANSNYNSWWMIVVPSVAMFFTVTVYNLVGSGLRDAMDPRLRV